MTRWRPPSGPGIRLDSGIEEGSVVSEHYDPLIAKLLVVADDRPAAIARMGRALDELEVGGIQTTLPFHRWLLRQAGFSEASGLSTDLVDRTWQPTELVSVAALRAAELAARAAQEAQPSAAPSGAAANGNGHGDATWWRAGISEATEPLP